MVEKFRVRLDGGVFRLYRVPPGLHAALPDTFPDSARRTSRAALRQFLALVPGLHAHIFMLHLADLPVGGGLELLHRPGEGIVPQAAVRLFLHFLKVQPGLAPARCLVKDALCF